MWVARQAHARQRLLTEVVQVLFRQSTLEKRPGVDAGRGVALEEDLVARDAIIFPLEEMVEANFVERGRAGIGRQVAADSGRPVVGPQDHRHGVPSNQPPDSALELLVAREERLLLGADGVDVAGLRQWRQADVELTSAFEQLVQEEAGAFVALLAVNLVQRIQPFLGLGGIDVGQLVLELVVVHVSGPSRGPRRYSGLTPSGRPDNAG